MKTSEEEKYKEFIRILEENNFMLGKNRVVKTSHIKIVEEEKTDEIDSDKSEYIVTVLGDSSSTFVEKYSQDEINLINKFFKDMEKHKVSSYDIPAVSFEKIK
jgi:hypothetical protein